MEIKDFLKKVGLTFLIIVAGFLLQTSIFPHFRLAGVTPNILIAITSIFGFSRGQKSGILIGFTSGLLLDVFSGFYFGYFAFCFMVIGYLNGFFKKVFFGDDLILPMMLVSSSSAAMGFVNYLIFLLKNNRYNIGAYFTSVIMPETVYTLIASIFVYYIILSFEKWIDSYEKRSSNKLG